MNTKTAIKFKSNEIRKIIYRVLEKDEKEYIYQEDLEQITKIAINPRLFVRPTIQVDIADLCLLKNLETLYLRDISITDYQIQCLNQIQALRYIQMNKCKFEDLDNPLNLENLETLVMVKCYGIDMEYFKELKNVKNLKIITSSIKSYKKFEEMQGLENLYLQDLEKTDLKKLLKMNNLKLLNLDGSTVKKEKYENILKDRIKVEHSRNYVIL